MTPNHALPRTHPRRDESGAHALSLAITATRGGRCATLLFDTGHRGAGGGVQDLPVPAGDRLAAVDARLANRDNGGMLIAVHVDSALPVAFEPGRAEPAA